MGPATRAAIRPYARFSGTSRAAASRTSETTRVAVNRAGAAELATLPGVGPHLAQAIVEDRARNGPYRAPGDLLRVRGIGPGVLKRIEGRIFIP
jgi:competence protein ComEA